MFEVGQFVAVIRHHSGVVAKRKIKSFTPKRGLIKLENYDVTFNKDGRSNSYVYKIEPWTDDHAYELRKKFLVRNIGGINLEKVQADTLEQVWELLKAFKE